MGYSGRIKERNKIVGGVMSKKEAKDEKKLSNDELISLYGIFHDMLKRCTEEVCNYMSVYINSNILILGGGIAILSTMDATPFKYLALILCGILVVIISTTYMKSTKRVFYNQLEYIA